MSAKFPRGGGGAGPLLARSLIVCAIKDLQSHKAHNEPQHDISNNLVCATSKGSDQPAHTRSLIRAFACRLNIL